MANTLSSMPRQNRSVALDFDPSPLKGEFSLAGALICAPDLLLDRKAIHKNILKLLSKPDSSSQFRTILTEEISDAYLQGREVIKSFCDQNPFDAHRAIYSYAFLADQVVQLISQSVVEHVFPLEKQDRQNTFGVVAVGGFGRGEMAPFSDVDLLFLIPEKSSGWAEKVVEEILYVLWDLKLKIGHSTRTVTECLTLGKQDQTIRTALLEARFLGGDRKIFARLQNRLERDVIRNSGPEFVELKLSEREDRHVRQGGQRYMLEPNVKEGKGGLRDLQSLYWITKYLSGAHDYREMIRQGYFTDAELADFIEAENFLWTVRCHLHLSSGRATEQLTFDAQVSVAERMGYAEKDGRLAVEWFMQDYFRHATLAGDLTRIFLTKLEAENIKKQPSFGARLLSAFWKNEEEVAEGFSMNHGRLDLTDPEQFLRDPLNILRIFEEALRSDILIHPDTMRIIKANLELIDDEIRSNPEAYRIFLRTLLDYGNPERALRRMNELGVLGAFIPEFGRIIAMMQFNHYHHYTVDEHTIQCIAILSMIERRELLEDLPIASEILKAGVNRKVLFVALLLHDIGKGLPEDHSIAGARIASEVAPRMGLNEQEVETVIWLIREHLTMSDFAQKRDLSDPRTLRDFAKRVQSVGRLNLLTTLTVCDIRGVGPGTLNQWKTQLLRTLYRETQLILQGAGEAAGAAERSQEAIAALVEYLPKDWTEEEKAIELDRHYDPYWQGLDTDTQLIFANLMRDLKADEIKIDIQADEQRSASRTCFVLQDHPGIFSRLAGALALVGANVVDARSYTSKDGYAVSVFWIQDAKNQPFEVSRLKRLKQMIVKSLKGEVVAREAIKDRDKIKKRERDFIVPTEISFDNEGSEIYTIVEVDTRDRPGLLYDMTRTMSANNIYIASAIIATYGAQAVDVFYVKDMFGLKLHSKAKRDALEKKLREAIDTGAQRATQ